MNLLIKAIVIVIIVYAVLVYFDLKAAKKI
ncbi:MAG: hypothetical protein UR43_C0016G0020 [candidate division TM6 bacterium GW2011_GWF2_33_332]|nr:MAG: hypothetical protein UR43_C0016G0020 [candidate division TM6 bacterium GW2011_GWF2_33_332]